MTKMKAILSVLIITFGIASSASAISYTYTDTYKPNGTDGLYMSAWGNSIHNGTFDITEDGFDPNTQYVTSASIALTFWDDCDWFEIAKLNVGTNRFYWEVDSGDKSIGLSSLFDLSDNRQIDCYLKCRFG
jgi:ABC-type antimicrobial peptide transport system permease subunit